MDFVEAESLEHALEELAERGDEATVLAGGTDLLVDYQRGGISPSTFLHIRRIADLGRIEPNGRTEVGPLVTYWQLMGDPHIAAEFPALAEAAATVGGRQTQNVGTVGGNVANASPAADTAPPLLIADAVVHLATKAEERLMPLADFWTGRKQTACRPDEMITRLSLDRPGPRTGEVYLKVGRRKAMEVAVVGLAMRLSFDDAGSVSDARVAVCSVAPRPFRAAAAEAALVGGTLDDASLTEAGRVLSDAASPIDDPRATAAYRRRVLAPLLRRAAAICRDRAGN